MRVRAEIAVELQVESFAEAARHEAALQEVFRQVQAQYPSARFTYRNRRAPSGSSHQRGVRRSGNLNTYVEHET